EVRRLHSRCRPVPQPILTKLKIMPLYSSNGSSSFEESLPKCVQEYLCVGAGKGERNNTLFRIACQCLHAGCSQDQVEERLVARAMADGLSEGEARKTVASAYDREQRAPPIGSVGARTAPSHTTPATPSPSPKSPPKQPVLQPLPTPIADGFRVILETCFQPGEKIVLGKGSYSAKGELVIDGGIMNSRES